MHATGREAASELDRQLGLRHGDAMILVDLQRDFLPGGALAVQLGDEIIPRVNGYVAAFAKRSMPIFMTRDWHPPDHCSFKAQGGPWPPHCVRETQGAEWPDGFPMPPVVHVVSKATQPDLDAYSGFQGTTLANKLQDLGVKRVFVAGLATDYCVRATVLDARELGFDVVVLEDAIRGVEVNSGDSASAIAEMTAAGAALFRVDSEHVA